MVKAFTQHHFLVAFGRLLRCFVCFDLQVDAFQEVELLGAALQGLLLDFRLWSDAGVEAQALLLEGVSSVVRVT